MSTQTSLTTRDSTRAAHWTVQTEGICVCVLRSASSHTFRSLTIRSSIRWRERQSVNESVSQGYSHVSTRIISIECINLKWNLSFDTVGILGVRETRSTLLCERNALMCRATFEEPMTSMVLTNRRAFLTCKIASGCLHRSDLNELLM